MSFMGGQGVEWWFNGLSRFPGWSSKSSSSKTQSPSGSGYVEVEGEVNGEKVEQEMGRERRTQLIRGIVSGIGFAMGVVGIWGDGA